MYLFLSVLTYLKILKTVITLIDKTGSCAKAFFIFVEYSQPRPCLELCVLPRHSDSKHNSEKVKLK